MRTARTGHQGEHVAAWRTFSAEVGGVCHLSDDGTIARIEVPHATGQIVIERRVTTVLISKVPVPMAATAFTTLRPTVPAHRFSVARAGFGASVARWFGRDDVQVGDPVFDAEFTLKSDSPGLLRALFDDAALRAQYRDCFDGTLALHDDTPFFRDPTPGVDVLELALPHGVDDAAQLRRLFELYTATLDRVGGWPV